jgi:uncharacterized protein with PQ loop repeat
VDLLGWFGGVLLALCAVPEVISAIRNKQCNLSHGFLWMWYIGEWMILVPILANNMAGFLVFNYTLNIVLISVLMYYKYSKKF